MVEAKERFLGGTPELRNLSKRVDVERSGVSLIGSKVFPTPISGTRGQLPLGASKDEAETETCTRQLISLVVSPEGKILATTSPDPDEAQIPLHNYPNQPMDDIAFPDDLPPNSDFDFTHLDDLVESVSFSTTDSHTITRAHTPRPCRQLNLGQHRFAQLTSLRVCL